jgi:transcriptional regulator with XRE-family HTH domain
MKRGKLAQAFGKAVRSRRATAGLSQEDFADRCGLHRTYIGFIERGEKTVTIETANKLARALRVPLSELIAEAERAGR